MKVVVGGPGIVNFSRYIVYPLGSDRRAMKGVKTEMRIISSPPKSTARIICSLLVHHSMSKKSDNPANLEEIVDISSSINRSTDYWELLLNEGRRTIDKQSELLEGLRSNSFDLIKINLLVASLVFAVQRLVVETEPKNIPSVVLLFTFLPLILSILLSWDAHQTTGESRIGMSSQNMEELLKEDDSYKDTLEVISMSQCGMMTQNGSVANKVTNRMLWSIVLIFVSLGGLTAMVVFY